MQFDSFEKLDVSVTETDTAKRLASLHKGFDSKLTATVSNYFSASETAQDGIAAWIGENAALNVEVMPEAMDIIKAMYEGKDMFDIHTLGLEEIKNWNIHPDYVYQCTKQHAGYAAEVISTAKENLIAKLKGTGVTTFRADDRPDLFKKNDQYVDKIRVDAAGNIIERIQTKFVGKDAKSCLDKLKSSDYEKYLFSDKVDKIEIPKDFYDDVKVLAKEQMKGLEKEIETLKANGNEEALAKKQKLFDRLKAIDEKVEKSTVSSKEAVEAVKNPAAYVRNTLIKEALVTANKAGLETGMDAAKLTVVISTVDNLFKYMNGEITITEAVVDTGKDGVFAGGIGYTTGFVTSAVSTAMSKSSHVLISKVGGSCAPAAVVSWGVQSYDTIVDYAQGEISGSELAYNLGENAATVAGGIAAGAAAGSIVPGAGTAVGAGVGFVSSMVGCALASEAYAAAVEHGGEGAEALASKAQEFASNTVEMAKAEVPEKVDFIRESINGFATENDIPIRV